jgi:hypothetical protein
MQEEELENLENPSIAASSTEDVEVGEFEGHFDETGRDVVNTVQR